MKKNVKKAITRESVINFIAFCMLCIVFPYLENEKNGPLRGIFLLIFDQFIFLGLYLSNRISNDFIRAFRHEFDLDALRDRIDILEKNAHQLSILLMNLEQEHGYKTQ